jgi:hypothetical protein
MGSGEINLDISITCMPGIRLQNSWRLFGKDDIFRFK